MHNHAYRGLLSVFLLLMAVAAGGNAGAPATDRAVLIIDPGYSVMGRCLEAGLEANVKQTAVTRLTRLDRLAPVLGRRWSALVCIDLDPILYPRTVQTALRTLLADEQCGVMFVGIPAAAKNRREFLRFFGRRLPADIRLRIPFAIRRAAWIWADHPARENETARFRRVFRLAAVPERGFLLMAADNIGHVWLNGRKIGDTHSWMQTQAFEVGKFLVKGDNVLAVECENVDGPAGMLLELSLCDARNTCRRIVTDATWKQTTGNPAGWQRPGFDDSAWKPARRVAPVGSGPWGTRVAPDYSLIRRPVTVAASAHPVSASPGAALGRFGVPYALYPRARAVGLLQSGADWVAAASPAGAGPKNMLFARACPPAAAEQETAARLRTPAFTRWTLRAVRWLAGAPPAAGPVVVPPPASSTGRVAGRWARGEFFPVAMQLSPLPGDYDLAHKRNFYDAVTRERLRAMIDDMRAHGITSLYLGGPFSLQGNFAYATEYAQRRGLGVTVNAGVHSELFGRKKPPKICIYADSYAAAVRKKYLETRRQWQGIRNLLDVFPYQDEPFHWGTQSFGYNPEVRREFRKRYHYDLPPSLDAVRNDPVRWLDVINFRSDYFPDGWRKVYKIIKSIDPDYDVILTHDSHNTFGGGVGKESGIAIDDVFHWGGDFADVFVFDIYPYMMTDFRYGEYGKIPKPRLAQTHFAMAQMRNLTRTFGKTFGFWFGTCNDTWFKAYLNDARRARYWSENEMGYTAIANDADFLCAGFNIPQDQKHWDTLGRGLRVVHKVGKRLLATRRLKSRAAFLFPRTQYIQLQREYWNVAQSFEMFQRAFGELDVIHEEQVTDARMNGYRLLVLCDVELLPERTAAAIRAFVRAGGIVVADRVPELGRCKEPLRGMERLFGVTAAGGKTAAARAPAVVRVRGRLFGSDFAFPAVPASPVRPGRGEVLLRSRDGRSALSRNRSGKGAAYLLGFCLKATAFRAWAGGDAAARGQLRALLAGIAAEAAVSARVHSANPDIEAAVRANDREAFLFVIAHEAENGTTEVTVRDLPFAISRVLDVESGAAVPFVRGKAGIRVRTTVDPETKTRLLNLLPAR